MISPQVIQELLTVRQVLHYLPASPKTEKGWTQQEQQLFWDALAKFPQGPWTTIAEYIGSKSTRQAMTHGQKLRQKLNRWRKRLRRTPAAAIALAEDPEQLDDDVKASIALTSAMMSSGAMSATSMMVMARSTSPIMASASMAMPALAASTSYQQGGHMIYDAAPVPHYKTRANTMLTSAGYGLEAITTAGLSNTSYSELLMAASLPFPVSSGVASFVTTSEAGASAAFDRMIATMTTVPSLPASFVSSERQQQVGMQLRQHSHQVHRETATTSAAAAVPTAFEDDDVRYTLPQSMVDDLADVLWD